MKTIREQIIERIIAQLQTIIPVNGYNSNIGSGHVYRQESIVEQDFIPALSIWELSETRERNGYGGTVRVLNIKIEAIVPVYENQHPATISNELLGDIEKALIIGDVTLDELVDDIQDIAAEIIYLPEGRKLITPPNTIAEIIQLSTDRRVAGASIDFEISYTTEWGDPYT